MRSFPSIDLGNAMTSRILDAPHTMATNLSSPDQTNSHRMSNIQDIVNIAQY